jgi:hypothetical protein
MIELPKRSVTRFFIPLIDVLTLLFCIFLLMPIVSPAEGAGETVDQAEELARLKRDNERLRGEGGANLRRLTEELERLRREKAKVLQERLATRVLEIDGATGKLYYYDPDRVEIRNRADAVALLDRDRRKAKSRELFYLMLYPRGGSKDYPTRQQLEDYERWFDEVALRLDIPGAGLEGGRP